MHFEDAYCSFDTAFHVLHARVLLALFALLFAGAAWRLAALLRHKRASGSGNGSGSRTRTAARAEGVDNQLATLAMLLLQGGTRTLFYVDPYADGLFRGQDALCLIIHVRSWLLDVPPLHARPPPIPDAGELT